MMSNFPISEIRKDFPILETKINNNTLVYFDNAATTQKPLSVIDSLSNYYKNFNSNIHRGAHHLAEKATEEFESTREIAKKFINATSNNEIIFTRGATEGINLVASSYCRNFLDKGDEIIISEMEHHSNIVPWQMVAKENDLVIKTIKVTEKGELDIENFRSLLNEKTKFVSIVYISNTLGTVNPVKELVKISKEAGAKVMVDGAQATSHKNVDVSDLNCDFFVFSAHKMYGPTGVGILYGKEEILDKMPPYMGGGEMIKDVSFEDTTYNTLPYKFEAGTPNIGDVIGFKKAIEYLNHLGRENIYKYETEIRDHAWKELKKIDRIKLVGTSENKIGIFSFYVEGFHFYDLGLFLDARGIAIRTGHHCTQPLMDKMNLDGTARVSLAMYNTYEEIDYFIDELKKIISK